MTSAKLFLTVCNLAASAGWAVIAVMLIRLLLGLPGLRRIPRRYVCLLWAVVGLRLVFPFSPESVLSLIPSAEVLPQTILYDRTPEVTTGVPALNAVINESVMPSFTPNPGDSVNPMQVLTAVGSWVWIAGAVLMLVYMLASYLLLYRRMRFATRLAGEDGVYESDAVSSPFVFGLIRPKIYLPYSMDAETRAHVIAHERAHLSRGDHFLKPFACLLLSVYWFHPLLWAAYILLCRDIESACDERAARDMTAAERKSYAAALVRCSVRTRQITACPLAFGETGVKRRVTAILDYRRPTLWVLIAAVVLCVVFAVCFGTNPTSLHGMTPMMEYDPAAVVYENGMFSYVQTVETAPSFCVDEDGVLWMRYPMEHTRWVSIGTLKQYAPDKSAFRLLFEHNVNVDGTTVSADTLYRQCKAAWRAEYIHPANGKEDYYTVMQRENGDILMLYSFRSADMDGTLLPEIPRWIYKLNAGNAMEGDVALPHVKELFRFDTAYAGTNCPDYEEIYQMPWAALAAKSMEEMPPEFFKTEHYEYELKNASVIPILQFESAAELREFRYTYRDMFVFNDSLGDTIPAFDAVIQHYGDSEALFRDYILYVACVNMPPRSHINSIGNMGLPYGGVFGLHIDMNNDVSENSTSDTFSQFVIAAMPRHYKDEIHTTIALVE